MTSSWLSRDLAAIYRPYRKWEPDLVSQFLYAALPSNFVIYIRVARGFHQWRHRIYQVTLIQFADQVQNEDQSWYLRFNTFRYLQTILYMFGWKKNFISDIFFVIMWIWYNLQTMCKIRTRYSTSGSTHTIAFKLCLISCEDKRISLIMKSWLSHNLDTIYKPDTQLGPDIWSLREKFFNFRGNNQ